MNRFPPARRLLPLLYLASPALPVGAFSWSQGLAPACAAGLVHDAASLRAWLMDVLRFGLGNFDIPVLFRCCGAAGADDAAAFLHWDRVLLAGRESAELRLEEEQTGRALCRLLRCRNLLPAWMDGGNCGYVAAFALGAVRLCARLKVAHSALETGCAFVWSWLENQAACACKCLPLGQSAVQHIVLDIMPYIPEILDLAAGKDDGGVGSSLPGLALVSAAHERQYSRMFRS